MDTFTPTNKQVILLMFGLPIMTAGIVITSMYAGYTLTHSEPQARFTVTAAPPKIDVNLPAPQIQFNTPAPQVSIQVPSQPAPTVNVTTPPAAVTVIDHRDSPRERAVEKESHHGITETPAALVKAENPAFLETASAAPAAPLSAPVPVPIAAAPVISSAKFTEAVKPAAVPVAKLATPELREPAASRPVVVEARPAAPASMSIRPTETSMPRAEPVRVSSSSFDAYASPRRPVSTVPSVSVEEPTLDTLYHCANTYIESYCRKHGLDPVNETNKWDRKWHSGLEQAIADNIDTGEQSYINRMVISKRDYFNVEKTSPDKIVEACRLLLRYRDGQLAWLQAMKDAMTKENLKKTVAFLAAGP